MLCLDELLLHVSRGVRWDSDHVVTLTDELRAIAQERSIIAVNTLDRVHIGLDFFDASINRVAAWVIGTRCMIKALLMALLEPTEKLRQTELDGNFTSHWPCWKNSRHCPSGAVWDHYCLQQRGAGRAAWLDRCEAIRNGTCWPTRTEVRHGSRGSEITSLAIHGKPAVGIRRIQRH